MTGDCDVCGEEHNPYLANQRFWTGDYGIIDGIRVRTLCDDCHRRLIRS